MKFAMNEADKNRLLDKVLNKGEYYKFKIWGVLMANDKEYREIVAVSSSFNPVLSGTVAGALGSLSNKYSYIGMTDKTINFIILDNFNASKVKERLIIPITEIINANVKNSFIPKRKVATIKLKDPTKLKISLMENAIGTDIKNQKEGVDAFCEFLKSKKV